MGVAPWFSVYRAADLQTVCFRSVSANPAPLDDFISYAAAGRSFPWWRAILANGVSAWEDAEIAAGLAKDVLRHPYLAQIDLSQVDEKVPWARTGGRGHVTLWADPPLLLQGVVSYVQVD